MEIKQRRHTRTTSLNGRHLSALTINLTTVGTTTTKRTRNRQYNRLTNQTVARAHNFKGSLIKHQMSMINRLGLNRQTRAMNTRASNSTSSTTFKGQHVRRTQNTMLILRTFNTARRTTRVTRILTRCRSIVITLGRRIRNQTRNLSRNRNNYNRNNFRLSLIIIVIRIESPALSTNTSDTPTSLYEHPQA